MPKKYPEYQQLNLPQISEEILNIWKQENTFQESINIRKDKKPFVFYEGPPSANGMPGIHHMMARTIKDIFCRYKTQKGFLVNRKAGWDTHGLPVELSVEKELGITKEDIGKKISVEEYNKKCQEAVMKYTDVWNDLTEKMGYWVDMDSPYITYHNKYIETVWWLLGQLYQKGLIYKGYTIQPFSPAAGTGLSTHELNQPGTYRDVKDTTVTAQFKAEKEGTLLQDFDGDIFFIAWTTTPWTLPSNTALAVGPKIKYSLVKTFNAYTFKPITVVLASDLINKHFSEKAKAVKFEDYKPGDKLIPFEVLAEYSGKEFEGIKYQQLLPYKQPEDGDAFRVIPGDYVSTEDGTGIVHIAPSFGADDARVAKAAGIGSLTLVNQQGKFTEEMREFANKFVKNEYYDDGQTPDKSVDVEIAIKLKEENKAFKVEKYMHSYPHCWRTDKPILYYPLDSWFVKTTALKDRLIELNKTINWKPESTGTGRFGNWLENLQDWNLSRSRYWGIPIPIWTTEDKEEQICISSIEQLKAECDKATAAGVMKSNPFAKYEVGNMDDENYKSFDLHRPFADEVVLVSATGKPMHRESDLIDVWFDSGSMPYAQLHYPFENKELIDQKKYYPADFIAEGVDQTRGWFFTLHAIGTLVFDSVAFKNVVSNGLVLDKNGHKMSKRLGNAVDPFETMTKYGPDATRWYMATNAQPWDNLKFDEEGITEVQRKFFRALYNTYAFFALYANVDGFTYGEAEIPLEQRPEIDRWVLSKLNSLVKTCDEAYADYESTKAGRAIQEFVVDHLSNWYVRLCRRRFWKGDYTEDKIAAYQTLYQCLETVAKLSAPIAPFFMDKLFSDLNGVCQKENVLSIHLTDFPKVDESLINLDLEGQMEIAQKISSLVLGLRKKEQIRVRQPLEKIMVPVLSVEFKKQLENVKDLILSEVNVKSLEFLSEDSGIFVKTIKPNFKTLGPRYGKMMKAIVQSVNNFDQKAISDLESFGKYTLQVEGNEVVLGLEDVEISSQDVPGWLVANEGKYTVALDINISEDLRAEGIARELVNRIQNLRKDSGLEVTDKINLMVEKHPEISAAIEKNLNYICEETLAKSLVLVKKASLVNGLLVDLEEGLETKIELQKN